jgi:hypothetical protein
MSAEVRVEGFDKVLKARFVGPGKEGGFDLQLALSHDQLSYVRQTLASLRGARFGRAACT